MWLNRFCSQLGWFSVCRVVFPRRNGMILQMKRLFSFFSVLCSWDMSRHHSQTAKNTPPSLSFCFPRHVLCLLGFILSLSCLREASLWKTPGLVASSSLVAAFIQHNLFTWKVSVSEHSKTSAREDMNDCRVEEVCGSDTQFNPAGR